MHNRTETIEVYRDFRTSQQPADMNNSPPPSRLMVPEQPRISITDESPIDRFGPRLTWNKKRGTNLTTRSSCYSRTSDGRPMSGYEWEEEKTRLGLDNDHHYDEGTTEFVPRASAQWAVPVPLSVPGTARNSRLIPESSKDDAPKSTTHLDPNRLSTNTNNNKLTGLPTRLSDQNFPEPTLPAVAMITETQKTREMTQSPTSAPRTREMTPPPPSAPRTREITSSPIPGQRMREMTPSPTQSQRMREMTPSPTQSQLSRGLTPSPIQIEKDIEKEGSLSFDSPRWPNSPFSMSSTAPIRPKRGSLVSTSFREPTTLLSPFKRKPSFMSKSSRLEHSYMDTKDLELDASIASKRDLLLVIISVAIETLCTTLDRVIVTAAVPQITDHFNTIADVGWYASAYFLTASVAYLLYGKLFHYYSTKWLYIAALGIFELGSLISGVAPTSSVLVLGRAMAGLGAAGLMAGGVLIIDQSAVPSEKPVYLAILVSISGIMMVTGPLIGGALTEFVSWRWCFYIIVLLGAMPFTLLCFSYVPPAEDSTIKTNLKDQITSLDLESLSLLVPSMVCLLLAVQYGGIKYEWTSATTFVLFAIFAVTMASFGILQNYKTDQASIPSRVFLNRNVYGGMMASFCISGSLVVVVYYLPLWFQTVKQYSPVESGVMLIPLVLSTVIASVISGRLISIIGYYTPFILIAAATMALGGGLLTTLTDTTSPALWIIYEAIFGIGAGLGMRQSFVAVEASFKKLSDITTGVTIIAFSQMLGCTVAIAIAQSVFDNLLCNNVLTADLSYFHADLTLKTGVTNLKNIVSGDDLQTVLGLYNNAITRGGLSVATALGAMSILGGLAMEWHSVKGRGALEFIHLL